VGAEGRLHPAPVFACLTSPSKLELGGLKAGAAQALTETVTLTTEHIQRIAP
jgi:hypothetical protein